MNKRTVRSVRQPRKIPYKIKMLVRKREYLELKCIVGEGHTYQLKLAKGSTPTYRDGVPIFDSIAWKRICDHCGKKENETKDEAWKRYRKPAKKEQKHLSDEEKIDKWRRKMRGLERR